MSMPVRLTHVTITAWGFTLTINPEEPIKCYVTCEKERLLARIDAWLRLNGSALRKLFQSGDAWFEMPARQANIPTTVNFAWKVFGPHTDVGMAEYHYERGPDQAPLSIFVEKGARRVFVRRTEGQTPLSPSHESKVVYAWGLEDTGFATNVTFVRPTVGFSVDLTDAGRRDMLATFEQLACLYPAN